MVGIAAVCNAVQRRLMLAKEAGDEGWWGTWAEIAFRVSRTTPYITMPRQVGRLQMLGVCDQPVDLHNQFYEYLRFGNGRLPKNYIQECHQQVAVFSRNNTPGFVDLTSAPQYIAVYPVDPIDAGVRVLVQGTDVLGKDIYTMDGSNRIKGVFVDAQAPFKIASDVEGNPIPFYSITGYQKSGTVGRIEFHQVSPTTGADVTLHSMEPGETTGWYRRYYLNQLPYDCCSGVQGSPCSTSANPGTVTVSAIVKLEPIDVGSDTDYFVLQNQEAMIEEAQAVRYGDMDTPNAKQFEARHHSKAIGLLNGELTHYLGKQEPAVQFAPFGSARLCRQKIGTLI